VNVSHPVHTVVTFAVARQVLDGLIWPATADRSGGASEAPRLQHPPRSRGPRSPADSFGRRARSLGGQGTGHANQLPHPNGDGGTRQGLALGTAALRIEVPCR
jgi:hypothetical protein